MHTNEAIVKRIGALTFNGKSGEGTCICRSKARPSSRQLTMRFRSLALSMIFAALLAGSVTVAAAQVISITVPQPHSSVPNQIIDFYAGGTSEGYTLRVSPQGGTLSINNYLTMGLMPWGYVTTQWTTGQEYVIFLVNVTQTNFRIGFLYLTNSSAEGFILRLFDYGSENVNLWTFQGITHVYNRTVSTSSIQVPMLHLPPPAAFANGISALGPQLYLTTKGGLLLNGTTVLNIFPVMNQLFPNPTDYNEVWSLLTDEIGNYYFAILYMPNNDPSHVIIEHQLRLNDYRRLNGRTVDARWQRGSFENSATVRMPMPNLTVNVDGFPFQTNNNGLVSLSIPNGIVTVQVPDTILNSTNSELTFAGWNEFGSSNPLSIRVNSTLDITAKYESDYALAVNSAFGNPEGSGVYSEGANATFSVEKEMDYGNRTRRVFEQWVGDSNSTNNQAWIIINAPKNVVAVWKTQYTVTLATLGLPPDANAVALVGNSLVTLNGTSPYSLWADANHPLSISVRTTQIQDPSGNYSFQEIQIDNQPYTGVLDVAQPIDVSLVFTPTTIQSESLSLQVTPSIAVSGIPLSITGSINPMTAEPTTVAISYSTGNGGWQHVANVPVAQNGEFAYTWEETAPGNYSIKASWSGNSNSSTSQIVGVRVVNSVPMIAGSDLFIQILQSGLAAARGVPYLGTLVRFTGTLMTLGYILASFVIPSGPPIAGYFIGSIFVGFILVFPFSAAVVLVRAARTRRRPSSLWLTPLLVIWLSSLALVLLSPALSPAQPLLVTSEVLLVLSNVFAIPMLASFRLAKLVA